MAAIDQKQQAGSSRRRAEREARRRFILESARGLLAEKGIGDIRMDDIAAASEYTRRTLYSYFKSRDDIWLRINVEDMAARWESQKRALAEVEGGLARIVVWAEVLYASWKARPNTMLVEQYWDFHGIERERVSPEVFGEFEALNDELATGLREIFNAGIEDGSLRPDLPVDVCISQFIHSLRAVLGRALSSSYSFAEFDADQYVRHFLDQYQRSVRSDAPRTDS